MDIYEIVNAIGRVERAIKDKTSTATLLWYMFCGVGLWTPADDMWHAKWRYALTNGVSRDKVMIDTHPHDCAFLKAPVGEKYCHYDREVSTIHRARTQNG